MKYNEEDIIQVNISKNMWERLIEFIDDNDYCPFCDNHPSHGHNKNCILYNQEID